MRKSMSAKRCLLIAAALWVAVSQAQVIAWTYSSAYHAKTNYDLHLTGYDVNNIVYLPLKAVTLELENRLVYTDKLQEDRWDRLNNRFQVTLDRKWRNLYTKAYYRGDYYNYNFGRIYFPQDGMLFAKRTYKQQSGVSTEYAWDKFFLTANARHRSFFYEKQFDNEPEVRSVDDCIFNTEAGYVFYMPFSLYVSGSSKTALNDKTDKYDFQTLGTGLKLDLPINLLQKISGQTGIEWRKSQILSASNSERMIPVNSRLRYARMFTPQVTAFLNYENRSFYDREQQAMLFNSHFLRASGKYTLDYDPSLASFVEIGGKLSPHGDMTRKSSNVFCYSELKTIDRLYLGGGIDAMPDRLTQYKAVARYFFMPNNEIFVNYIYTDDEEVNGFNTFIAGGLRMMF